MIMAKISETYDERVSLWDFKDLSFTFGAMK